MSVVPNHPPLGELIGKQKQALAAGELRSLEVRRNYLLRLEKCLMKYQERMIEALDKDLGKPEAEAYLAEYHFLLQEIRLVRSKLSAWLSPERVGSPLYFHPCRSEVLREPYGCALIIAPWNYPFQLAMAPLISAVAAGNTVVLKPSEISTHSEALIGEIISEVFPPETVSVVTGGAEVAGALLEEKWDFIFFTGSTGVGRLVAKKAAEHLTPCVLELGGKCPCVVDSRADLKVAAGRILAGKFFNGGQTCFAPDFVAVHHDVKEELLEAMQCELEAVPWHEEMATVINKRHYDRLRGLLDGVEEARIIQSGADDEEKLRLAPRVVKEVAWEDALMKEEIFGPVLPVISYEGDDELINRLQQLEDPLALYLFTEDEAFVKKVMQAKRSGGVCVNDTLKQSSNLELPFGGVGDSGYGRYRGKHGVYAFCYERAVARRGKLGAGLMDIKPPYDKVFKWLKRVMR
ncbi:aldehyde dehydrogenase (NAD+) [Rubritalea squalenifaciens DSM 18772]|uniref:Aldehyde dehydrogenase n=1 Tax=Rubritalea squalenifaciens DSM 18772 TaxID=1123071 RepID=A0A1M6STE3_9BACT|nr:aldehyde dehydrogenase family protein [Rubritalea squalenifaciens]SHK47959.1 aldehyde dehydrogenase (NAD+) [Rubritalea squalenifaciens DSM 18772]